MTCSFYVYQLFFLLTVKKFLSFELLFFIQPNVTYNEMVMDTYTVNFEVDYFSQCIEDLPNIFTTTDEYSPILYPRFSGTLI